MLRPPGGELLQKSMRGWRAALLGTLASAGVPNLDQWDENAQRAYDALQHAPLPSTPPVRRSGEGVVYAVGGSEEFFDQEVVPCVRHLTRLENSGDSWRHLTKRTLKFMLFHERRQMEFKKWDLVQNFFDATEAFEDEAPASMTRVSDPRIRVKSVKAWAFYRAPFERFVYLDFDSRPCCRRPLLYWPSSHKVVETRYCLCGNQIYGTFHAIDAMLARWRGDVGSLLDGASTERQRHTG